MWASPGASRLLSRLGVPARFVALPLLLAGWPPPSIAAAPKAAVGDPIVIAVAAGPHAASDLDRALDRVAELRAGHSPRPIVISLGPGTVRLTHPLRIDRAHAGPGDPPLTLRGAPNGASRIVGSAALTPLATRLDPALAARLSPPARDHVLAYRLPEAALARTRIMAPHLLKAPAEPLSLAVFDEAGALAPASWPKTGWATVAAPATDPGAEPGTAFTFAGDRMSRWRGEPDLWAEGYWHWGWLFESMPVVGLNAAAGRITLSDPPFDGLKGGARFRIVHALSELDGPGQWWRDEALGLLLAWPRMADPTLDVAIVDRLIDVDDASHVRIEGLDLEQSRGDLVTVRGGSDDVVSGGRLASAGRDGAVFEGARGSGVDGADIAEIGGTAVVLDGGRRETLAPGGLFLRHSRITRWAILRRTQSPAVSIGGVGAEVSDNVIHDAGDSAVTIHGNDHRVLRNEIAHVLAGATDAGAIYAGRDWTARGTVIAGNFIHDVRPDPGAEVKGIYLDDETSGFTVRDNLFLRVTQAVFVGGGRDNVVEGNVFVGCDPAIHLDSRGLTWAADAIRDPQSELRAAYAAMPVASPPWRRRYPGLDRILEDSPAVAKGNRFVDNVFVLGRPFAIDDGASGDAQVIRGNRGPDGIVLRSGRDIGPLAAKSNDPADFADLVDRAGAQVFRLDLRGLRH